MIAIQQVGLEIMNKTPQKFYVFVGSEYGIKLRYIAMLEEMYGRQVEYPTMASFMQFAKTRRLIPEPPTVYVIRYDEEFLSSLSASTEDQINTLNISGTLVLIYQSDAAATKCDKYLGEHTVSIDRVSRTLITKYLNKDFPDLADINYLIAEIASDYYQASVIANEMKHLSDPASLTREDLMQMTGKSLLISEDMFKQQFASKNFAGCAFILDSYEGDASVFLFAMMSVMTEMEKLSCNSFVDSPMRQFVRLWTPKDIYNMFMNCYSQLNKLRTISSDYYSSLLYLCSLLLFREIPAVEELA